MALPLPTQLRLSARPEPATLPTPKPTRAKRLAGLASLVAGPAIWFTPPPDGLPLQTWHLFAIFASTIFSVVIGASPILTAAVISIAAAVLTGTLAPDDAYAGFANPAIILIVAALLVARAFGKCGLGRRLGYRIISLIGGSTLGLSYGVFALDALIAPAIPSNTARARELYPFASEMADAVGATPGRKDRKRLARFLMFSGVTSLTLSSALWLTAMAGNLLGVELARQSGVKIGFLSWLVASAVPTLLAISIVPFALYKLIQPEVAATPDAPAQARRSLAAMGPWTHDQKTVGFIVLGMVVLWGLTGPLGVVTSALALLGLGLMLATNVLTVDDVTSKSDVLATYVWFAALFTMSSRLSALGFMEFVGQRLASPLAAVPVALAVLVLVIAYVGLHYVFVSTTVQLLALFPVFLAAGIKLGVSAPLLAYQLLFATCYVAALGPRGSSANLPFMSSGALSRREMYRMGAQYTTFIMLLYLVVGAPWVMLVTR